ncbi:hypothetical protein D3C79_429250 [compost metagenome]
MGNPRVEGVEVGLRVLLPHFAQLVALNVEQVLHLLFQQIVGIPLVAQSIRLADDITLLFTAKQVQHGLALPWIVQAFAQLDMQRLQVVESLDAMRKTAQQRFARCCCRVEVGAFGSVGDDHHGAGQVHPPVRSQGTEDHAIDLGPLRFGQVSALPGQWQLQAGAQQVDVVVAKRLVTQAQVDFSQQLLAAQGQQARLAAGLGIAPEAGEVTMQALTTLRASDIPCQARVVLLQGGDLRIQRFKAFERGHGEAPVEGERTMPTCEPARVVTGYRLRQNPLSPSAAELPRPSQDRLSQRPSPSRAANSPMALSKAINSGQAKIRRTDCDLWLMPAPLVACAAWPTTGRGRCRAR